MKPAKEIKTGSTDDGIARLDTGEKNRKLPKKFNVNYSDIQVNWRNIIDRSAHKSDNKSGFFDLEDNDRRCKHREHNPPMHLYIPPGKGYRHVCPGCGREVIMYGQNYAM